MGDRERGRSPSVLSRFIWHPMPRGVRCCGEGGEGRAFPRGEGQRESYLEGRPGGRRPIRGGHAR
eukprot:9011613-Pyramimonas_sp.AAC.1